jgi:phosphomannomutase
MPEFGTSGLRGLATEFTPVLVAGYTRCFLSALPEVDTVLIGRDLRASSPEIRDLVVAGAAAAGVIPVDCGVLPTPALAFAAITRDAPAIMITGSHIPADQNGLKFYLPTGEITKADEAAIADAYGRLADAPAPPLAVSEPDDSALAAFRTRYTDFFGAGTLAGWRIGVYQHSSTARDLLVELVEALGGIAIPLARSEHFVAVDTEAIDPETRGRIARWAAEHRLDAVVSTDGDADRPMLAGADGAVVPGDILGPLVARYLGAEAVAVPVSANTLLEELGAFAQVGRCRIGSPYVIAEMERLKAAGAVKVAGYEPNGGFLLGFEAASGGRRIAPLMTRDFALPILATLALAAATEGGLPALLAALPPRFTATDRLTGIPRETSQRIVADLLAGGGPFPWLGRPQALDTTDGARMTYGDGAILHVRPSGNAPELRCYVEADSPEAALALLSRALEALRGEVCSAQD